MNLYPLNVCYLYVGMPVNFEIYHYVKGVPVLLCNDIILSDENIFAIKQILDREMHIYVKKDTLDMLLDDNEYYARAQSALEERVGYDKVKTKICNTLNAVEESGRISSETIEDVSGDIYNTIESAEMPALIQCINGIRNVDEYLYTHCTNVALLNGLIGKWLGYDDEATKKLVAIGYVHDLGKLKIPKSILDKPARLSDFEFGVIKNHPSYSRKILVDSGYDDDEVLEAVIQHHERQNGTGYPKGLGAEEISTYANITAISDVYDAMVAKRSYKAAHSPFEVLEMFSKSAFSELDMRITKIFLEKMPQELVDKHVLLSDGTVGTVAYVNACNYRYPLVKVNGRIIATNENLYCLRMHYDISQVPDKVNSISEVQQSTAAV